MLEWVAFAEAFPVAPEASFENLKKLNDELSVKSVLLGNGLKPSEADVIVFSVIHSSLVCTLSYLSYLLCFQNIEQPPYPPALKELVRQ